MRHRRPRVLAGVLASLGFAAWRLLPAAEPERELIWEVPGIFDVDRQIRT
ncbi:MAG: hypothetical protein ACYDH9_12965 [Limisphaerales bacterium]